MHLWPIGAYDSKIFQLIVGILFKYDIREKYLLERIRKTIEKKFYTITIIIRLLNWNGKKEKMIILGE